VNRQRDTVTAQYMYVCYVSDCMWGSQFDVPLTGYKPLHLNTILPLFVSFPLFPLLFCLSFPLFSLPPSPPPFPPPSPPPPLPSLSIYPLLQEAHVNSCYKHFYYFVEEFNLIDAKEFEPLVS